MILIVSATVKEVEPLLGNSHVGIGVPTRLPVSNSVDAMLLVTGVGAAPAAYHLGTVLASQNFSLVVGVGIAGTYNPSLNLGDIVLVSHDTFADYGVDDNGQFKTVFSEKIVDANGFPFSEGWLTCEHIPQYFSGSKLLPKQVKGITVAMASGSLPVINNNLLLYSPDVETMEGAALFFSCLCAKVPFISIRSISNRVEPRNRDLWEIPLAIENLGSFVLQFLNSLP